MGGIEPDQDRDLPSEIGGEPPTGTAQQFADLKVVTERLESLLIPLQHRPGEQGEGDQTEHRDTDEPVSFPWTLVGTGEEDTKHVQYRRHIHGLGGPVVQSPDETSAPHVSLDMAHRGVRSLRNRAVELHQHHPGGDQDPQRRRGHPAQAPPQVVGVLGNRVLQRADPQPVVDDIQRPAAATTGIRCVLRC